MVIVEQQKCCETCKEYYNYDEGEEYPPARGCNWGVDIEYQDTSTFCCPKWELDKSGTHLN